LLLSIFRKDIELSIAGSPALMSSSRSDSAHYVISITFLYNTSERSDVHSLMNQDHKKGVQLQLLGI
jgi:hypothetical protein